MGSYSDLRRSFPLQRFDRVRTPSMGQHNDHVLRRYLRKCSSPPSPPSLTVQWLNIMYIIYGPSTLCAKLSVLFQIKRIFTTTRNGAVYWVIQVSIAANVIFYLGLFLSFIFQCWPREAIWNPLVKGVCTNPVETDFAAGILNMISDVEALILPGWAIWHLKMPVQRKVGIYAVFAVGMLAIVIGAVGLYWRIILLVSPDYTWTCTGAAMLV